ncbi:diacylglycerol O-acyltransferase 2B-like [Thrips palmi]|uniref:Diacylglycerol O-acyltransferase 2B-like n=1 Tax=Thrips palmi TaxID=161013 RepID=A0A6P8ZPY2_THRPL|nr:diacylglycerol O-acyltransferase 2B-like [Thrips palmi]
MDPRKSYLLSWHPHAFVPALQVTAMLPALFSEQLAAALPGGQVPVAFPGLDVLVATKPAFFLLPVLREVALALGFISCSERSLRHALRLPGKAVLLMTGAVQEVFRTRGDTNVFCLQRRGFCRVALAEGASLVPVVVLGENRGYRMLLPDAMEWLHSATGWRAVLPMGRGVLQDYVGVMPRRVPITVVVGAPIEVTATRSPSRQQVAALHASFVDAVRRLYDEHAPAHYKEHVPLVIET